MFVFTSGGALCDEDELLNLVCLHLQILSMCALSQLIYLNKLAMLFQYSSVSLLSMSNCGHLSLQLCQNGSVQSALAREGALSWRKPNLQDAGVTICVRLTTAAVWTLMSTA